MFQFQWKTREDGRLIGLCFAYRAEITPLESGGDSASGHFLCEVFYVDKERVNTLFSSRDWGEPIIDANLAQLMCEAITEGHKSTAAGLIMASEVEELRRRLTVHLHGMIMNCDLAISDYGTFNLDSSQLLIDFESIRFECFLTTRNLSNLIKQAYLQDGIT